MYTHICLVTEQQHGLISQTSQRTFGNSPMSERIATNISVSFALRVVKDILIVGVLCCGGMEIGWESVDISMYLAHWQEEVVMQNCVEIQKENLWEQGCLIW